MTIATLIDQTADAGGAAVGGWSCNREQGGNAQNPRPVPGNIRTALTFRGISVLLQGIYLSTFVPVIDILLLTVTDD